MAKAQYVGVSGVARRVSKKYIGVSGIARNVILGYVGVSGIARKFFDGGVFGIRSKFQPASNVKGTPSYEAIVGSDGKSITINMTSARTSNVDFSTDRNRYLVYISGIRSGDVVTINATSSNPLPSQGITISYAGTTIKPYSINGTRDYTFTAPSTSNLLINLEDGDYNEREDTLSIIINSITVNGKIITFL